MALEGSVSDFPVSGLVSSRGQSRPGSPRFRAGNDLCCYHPSLLGCADCSVAKSGTGCPASSVASNRYAFRWMIRPDARPEGANQWCLEKVPIASELVSMVSCLFGALTRLRSHRCVVVCAALGDRDERYAVAVHVWIGPAVGGCMPRRFCRDAWRFAVGTRFMATARARESVSVSRMKKNCLALLRLFARKLAG